MNASASTSASPVLSKAEFLQQFPWDRAPGCDGLHRSVKPVDDLWVYEYDFPIDRVWPVIADTSTLNRRLDLPLMTFEEREGRLFGSATYAGIFSEWEEIPWQWEYGRYLESARRYSKGIAKYVRGVFLLEDLGQGRTRYYVYFGWIPTGPLSRFLLKVGLNRLRSRYGATIETLLNEQESNARSAQLNTGASVPVMAGSLDAGDVTVNLEKLSAGRKALLAAGADAALVDRVLEFVKRAPDDRLYRIRVRELARQWDVDEKQLLFLFLHGTRAGLFYLTWDVICPHCRGVRSEVNHLGELPKNDECEVCEIDFDTQGINSFEVSFHVHKSVRDVEKQFFCSAEPARKDHIRMQLTLRPGESRRFDSRLGQGVYRMRVQGDRVYQPLELDPAYVSQAIEWNSANREDVLRTAPRPPVVLANTATQEQTYIVEENIEDRDMLRPVDLFNYQEFRDLFSREALAADIQLDVGLQTILFTDIVGSSRYYQDRGDQGAFAAVRKHFVEIYRIVGAHNGAVVKTIGDAAMAAFARPLDAILASIELQEYYSPENPASDLRLRISLHQGPCLAVNLNSNIDYFGNTVNLAAKLQALAEAGQIAFSQPVLEDREVRRHFSETKTPLRKLAYEQPWDGEALPVYRFDVS